MRADLLHEPLQHLADPEHDQHPGGASNRCQPNVRLETNRALKEAIQLYRSSGYREVAAFNDEPYAHHWFPKRINRKNRAASARLS